MLNQEQEIFDTVLQHFAQQYGLNIEDEGNGWIRIRKNNFDYGVLNTASGNLLTRLHALCSMLR